MKLARLGVVTLQDLTKYPNAIVESRYGHFAIILEQGLNVIRLCPTKAGYISVNSPPKFEEFFIKTPDEYPTKNSGYVKNHDKYFNPDEVAEVSLNPVLTPDADWLMPSQPNIAKAVWGPPGLFQGQDCPLAVLTNVGYVSVYETTNMSSNIPKCIYDDLVLKGGLHQFKDSKNYMKKLRDNCDALQTTGIGWCDRVSKKEACETYFVTAQKNGQIYIWNVSSTKTYETNLQFVLKHTFNCDLRHVNLIHWISLNGSRSILILCNDLGIIEAFQLEIIANEFKIVKQNKIWSEEDKMDVNMIESFLWESEFFCLILIKKSFVISVIIDDQLDVKNVCFENLSNFQITGFKMLQQNEFMIATLTGQMFKLDLTLNKFKKEMKYEQIEFDYDFVNWFVYGFGATTNNAFNILCISPCRNVDRIFGKTVSKLVFCYNDDRNYIEELKANRTMLLTNYWDNLDLAKLITFKNKSTREEWPTEFVDDMTLYEMKLCMWSKYTIQEIDNKMPILEQSMVKVILHEHAKKMLGYYVNLPTDYPLSDFKLKTIALYMNYIENYNGEINRNFPSELMIKATDSFVMRLSKVKIVCEWCDEEIKTIFCSQNHPRQWCCVTLQDISDSECLICPICGHLAHLDLLAESPLCTFCDVHFQKYQCIK